MRQVERQVIGLIDSLDGMSLAKSDDSIQNDLKMCRERLQDKANQDFERIRQKI